MDTDNLMYQPESFKLIRGRHEMIESASLALATFFATALATNEMQNYKRIMAIRATLIATGILLVFALVGEHLLASLGTHWLH